MIKPLTVLTLLFCLFSCAQKTEPPVVLTKEPIRIPTVKPEDLPPPIKAQYLDPDSVAPPRVVPLKYQAKVVPAHPNVYPVGTPKVVQIPKELHIVTLGKDVPMPEIIPAKPKESPVFQPKSVPALTSRMKDAAIYNIQHLSQDEGLPFGGISIIEDSKGHIWLGDPGAGVVRYDGENFFPFTAQEGIWAGFILMEDSKGNIWFGFTNGLGYYDGKKVIHFREQEKLKNNWWNSIFEDSKGHIWLGSDKGVYRYDPDNPDSNRGEGNFTFFKKENGLMNYTEKEVGNFFDNRVNAILEDSQGHIWWATQGSGVLRYDGKRIIHYTQKEGLISNYIKSILEDSKGQIWFGGGGEGTTELQAKGISIYNRDATTPQNLGGTFTNYTSKEGLSGNRITGMVEDDWGNIWIATYAGGLTCYDPDANDGQGNFIHYTTEEGLNNNSVNSIIKDSKENIWLVMNGRSGINRFNPNSFRHFTEKQGLSKNLINRILEDSKKNIWIGTGYGGLMKYDGQNFTHYSEKEDLLKAYPSPLLEDKQGNIWIRTREQGVINFDGNVFKKFGAEQGFINPYYFHAHNDRQGNVWINTWSDTEEGRSIRYNPGNGQITHFASDNKEGVGSGSMFEDKDHNLWFAGKGCVAKYDINKDQLNYVLQLAIENPGWVDFLFEDEEGHLWFSMDNDIRIFKMKKNGDNPTIPGYSKDQGFPDFLIRSVAIDEKQNVWFSSSDNGIGVFINGVKNIDLSKPAWIQYDKADGLKSRVYDPHSSYIDRKNQLWFGSVDAGVTILDLNTFELPTEAPQNLSLSQIDIQQQFISYNRLDDTTYRHTLAIGEVVSESFDSVVAFNGYPASLDLPYDLNHLTFHFSAIDWAAPHEIRYSYKMNGIDPTWSQPSTEAKADYRNLPYGSFTLEVKAIGKAKVWTDPISYSFTIRPPWWHTWWAYALYALLAVGTIGWYVQRLRRQVKQKQQQLEREQSLNMQLESSNQKLAVSNKQLEDINIANSRFVPKDFLQILGKESLLDLQLGDQTEATMTILFADLRDYTALSETITPEDNFKLINAFLGKMGPIIQQNGGFICQYLGDGLMALFKDRPERAIKAAIEMQRALQGYNKKRFVRNRQALRLGIGLNTGKLMMGVIGDQNRYESSVISDAVNTASRMEGLTKIFGCSVIVSEKTLAEIGLLDNFPLSSKLEVANATNLLDTGPARQPGGKVSSKVSANYRFLGKVKVKGKNQILRIYDFFEGDAEHIRQLKSATKADFEKAVHYYFDRKFGKAADLFKEIAKKFPEDIATEFYLSKAVKFVIDGVETGWSGAEEMVSK